MKLSHSFIFRLWKSVLVCLFIAASLATAPCFADEFSARHLGDYGNVTVMEVVGNFDSNNPDGSLNVQSRQAIAKEFFRLHKDEYDFVAIFTNFDYQRPPNAIAFYSPIKNDVQGIGQKIFDNSQLYGSNGKLQGTIDMWNLLKLVTNPLDPKFDFTVDTLVHETLHRWGAFVKFKDWNGVTSDTILGYEKNHWSFLFDSGGSTHLGNKWQNNGDGTFTSTAVRKYYSPLDLYLMGMIDKSKVPPTLLIENPAIDPEKLSELGATISGTAHYVTIDNIIAVEGERIPAAKDSQKQFKTAFIYAVSPGTFKSDDLYGIENLRNAYLTRFSILTDGKGLVQVASTPLENLPVNPGVRPPSSAPRTLPPNIDNGVTWLMNRQQTDGSWTDFSLTTERDTAEAVTTLRHFPIAAQSFQAGYAWLGCNASANTDFLARRIEATVQVGSDSSALVQELLARRNRDGGWGSNRNFISTPTDTAMALKALAVAGYSDSNVTGPAITYLQGTQNADGGWSGDDAFSTIQPTASVLTVFNSYRKNTPLETNLTKAVAFLATKQNPDGGFGNSPSTVYDTALAVTALQAAGADKTMTSRGVSYLLGQQSENGAWFDSPYQTTLAVRAVWTTTVDPDLSIMSEDISIIPATVTALPTNAVLSATIWNLGRNDVSQAKVTLYEGTVDPEHRLAEQTLAFPGQSPITVIFSIPITSGNGHVFYIVANPDNLLSESNKSNNTAAKSLLPEITYDFQVQAADITITPNPVDIGKDTKLAFKVTNRGTSDAYSVPVRLFIDQPGLPAEIAQLSVDIPAGSTVSKEVIWKASVLGTNLPLNIQIDPNNSFTELTKDNNSVAANVTVNNVVLTDPNLSVSYKDISVTPNPVKERENLHVTALIKNDGFAEAINIPVNFYNGNPAAGGTVLGIATIASLKPEESSLLSVDWQSIMESGDKNIYVKVDPEGAITETREDDNEAFLAVKVLSLPDLEINLNSIAVTPYAPKVGDLVTIAITVTNRGDLAASNILVNLSEGTTILGTKTIASLAGHSQTTVSFNYDTTGRAGAHEITAATLQEDQSTENNKSNNSANTNFTVFTTDLMLSEPYFSPNGDGVKDVTQFSYNLGAPQTATVEIIDSRGLVVRKFTGSEFENTAAVSIKWEGLNDSGQLMNDGEYTIRVKTANGVTIVSSPVVIDTNRSSLSEAIFSSKAAFNDLSCKMPESALRWDAYYSDFQRSHVWLPDGSGAVFYVSPRYWDKQNDGLHFVSSDGKVLRTLISGSWFQGAGRSIAGIVPSPDGKKIAFVTVSYTSNGDLWVIDADGQNLKLVESTLENYAPGIIHDIIYGDSQTQWSADSMNLYFTYSTSQRDTNYNSTLINNEVIKYVVSNGIKSKYFGLDTVLDVGILIASSSPNFTYIISENTNQTAVAINYYQSSCSWSWCERYHIREIKILDDAGIITNTGAYYQGDYYTSSNIRGLKWLAQNKLLYMLDKQYIYDIPSGSQLLVRGNVLSPDNKTSASFTCGSGKDVDGLTVFDWSTNTSRRVFHDEGLCVNGNSVVSDLKFSPDGSKIAFNAGYNDRVMIDLNKIGNGFVEGLQNVHVINDTFYLPQVVHRNQAFSWLPDGNAIVESVGIETPEAERLETELRAINVSTLENKTIGPAALDNGIGHFSSDELSAMPAYSGNFLVASSLVADSASGCITKQGRDASLWPLSMISSASNLVAELVLLKQQTGLLLTGTASDLNFEAYTIEYASETDLTNWYPIVPYNDKPVVGSTFTLWSPPGEGAYLVRLKVMDKAGNIAYDRKKVYWGSVSSLTNISKSSDVFSPNSDGVKDVLEIHYTVLQPLHLDVSIHDAANNLVRTFTRDYSGLVTDSIVWDGRNNDLGVVPDGQYMIRLGDYELYAQVDTGLPQDAIKIGAINYLSKERMYSVDLTAHATDQMIKSWTIEYGEGENPVSWTLLKTGFDQLGSVDGGAEKVISSYFDDQIGWLAGKRLRLTAEDFGGNKSSMLSAPIEERLLVTSWDGLSLPHEMNQLPSSSLQPFRHSIKAVNTIRLPLAEMILEYADTSKQWRQSALNVLLQGANPDLIWDNAAVSDKISSIRLKATDAGGNVFYSNELTVQDAALTGTFSLREDADVVTNRCSLKGNNDRYNPLTYLKLQKLDTVWTDVNSDDTSAISNFYGQEIVFSADKLTPGSLYRLSGTDKNGVSVTSNTTTFTDKCDGGFRIAVSYKEVDCGELSNSINLSIETTNSTPKAIALKDVKYFIKEQSTSRLLGSVVFDGNHNGAFTIYNANMADGKYDITAITSYIDLFTNVEKASLSTAAVVIDKVLPVAKVSYPANNTIGICPVKISDGGISRNSMDLEGVSEDANGITSYEVFYSLDQNPTSWSSAVSANTKEKISGTLPVKGKIGTWAIPETNTGNFVLKLKVKDKAGNVSCATSSFSVHRPVDIGAVTAAISAFSPNADGIIDNVEGGYYLNSSSTVNVKAFSLQNLTAPPVFNSLVPVRSLVIDNQQQPGSANFSWDGSNDAGTVQPDGRYAIAVFAKDICGETVSKYTTVEVDKIPPQAAITYPSPAAPVQETIIQIRGTANDSHLRAYSLQAGTGEAPSSWIAVASGSSPVNNDVLGSWNTYGIEGKWTLRLTVEDLAGNSNNATTIIDLGARKNLIKQASIAPRIFSPNSDGKLDTTLLSYELTQPSYTKIELINASGSVARSYVISTASPSSSTLTFDGKDAIGGVLVDGVYTVKITAVSASDSSVMQTETLSLVIDTSSPVVSISDPKENSFQNKSDILVTGSITDPNLVDYSVSFSGPNGVVQVEKGTQERNGYTFGSLSNLIEGTYTLIVEAKDSAGNETRSARAFTIDRTKPLPLLNSPKLAEYWGSVRNVIEIGGTITENNLEKFSLRYGYGEPYPWQELLSETRLPDSEHLFSLSVGKDSNIADGNYILSLYAKDKAGLEGDSRVKFVIDNTPPTVGITSHADGSWVKASMPITGIASDTNLDRTTLEIAAGDCLPAINWSALNILTTSVYSGQIGILNPLPKDGKYCLKLAAADSAGNKSEARISFIVDTHPPASPKLVAKTEQRTVNHLSWVGSQDLDLAGYFIYRNGQKIYDSPMTERDYLDQNLSEGRYNYSVTAVDLAGNESLASNAVELTVDLTPPAVKIASPSEGGSVSGFVDIRGTAFSTDDFKQYRLLLGQGVSSNTWTILRNSPVPVSYGSLTQWDTLGVPEGSYSLKLEAEDLSGNVSSHRITLKVDNTAPVAPKLISAVNQGADVVLNWQQNEETDLAGYVVFKNDKSANSSESNVSNLRSFLVTGSSFIDKAIPDGQFKYYIIAMDQAGNLSSSSNSITLNIDKHPPQASIIDPQPWFRFDSKVLIKAQIADADIASIRFQYKGSSNPDWVDIGTAVTALPYNVSFDPKALGLPYDNYMIRALATDLAGKVDPAPAAINITYVDLTPPSAPNGLKAQAKGDSITLSWNQNSEQDLDGYMINLVSYGSMYALNYSPVQTPSYTIQGLSDGTYSYAVVAVDKQGNRSDPSESTTSQIYTPILEQPFTPVNTDVISLHGSSPVIGSSIEITNVSGGGEGFKTTVVTDLSSNFVVDSLRLVPGENHIVAKGVDSSGNESKLSEQVVVVNNDAPAKPASLAADVQGYNVGLIWAPNSENDLVGYNVYRDGNLVNKPQQLSGLQTFASSTYYYNVPNNAVDNDAMTYWSSDYGYGRFVPLWIELALPSAELVKHLDIQWYTATDYSGKELLIAAKDFSIQAWSGYAWITLKTVSGNDKKANSIDLETPYRTEKLRIQINDTTDVSYAKQVRINDIKITKAVPVSISSFIDENLKDGKYTYQVSAIDYLGAESILSEQAFALVGDVVPPAAPQGLRASVFASKAQLDWSSTPNTEPDLAGYNVFRQDTNGWTKLNSGLIATTAYVDQALKNGAYTYRITAVDLVGNESLTSNEVATAVSITLPGAPVEVNVSAAPEGSVLNLSWKSSSGSIGRYFVYRKRSGEASFTKITPAALNAQIYRDAGLANESVYSYVITEIDAIENESPFSNIASGIPLDSLPPSVPVISLPTVASVPNIVAGDFVNIVGIAEAGSNIELFRSGFYEATAAVSDGPELVRLPLDTPGGYNLVLSPGGTSIAYSSNGYLWLKRGASQPEKIAYNAYSPVWSPDGKKIAYSYYQSGYSRISIYDLDTKTSSMLSTQNYVEERNPSWAANGTVIGFIRSGNVWTFNFETRSLKQITTGTYYSGVKLSPNGAKAACLNYSNVNVIDMTQGASNQFIAYSSDQNTVSWSPDSRFVAYVSQKTTGTPDISILDVDMGVKQQLNLSGKNMNMLTWTLDSSAIAYLGTEDDWSLSLRIGSRNGDSRLLLNNVKSPSALFWRNQGELFYVAQELPYILFTKPHFVFSNVPLKYDVNEFTTVAVDAAQNRSNPSAGITVIYDPKNVPDVAVDSTNLSIYPSNPKPGETVILTATVSNTRNVPVNNVTVDVYNWNSNGSLELISSQKIPGISAGKSATVVAPVTTNQAEGMGSLIVTIDPENVINEFNEENNTGTIDYYATDRKFIDLQVKLRNAEYTAREDVQIAVSLLSAGFDQNVTLELSVEDNAGNRVATIDTIPMKLWSGAIQPLSYSWNTANILSGHYRIMGKLKVGIEIIGESSASFTIKPEIILGGKVFVDKQNYGPNEPVGVNVTFNNASTNNVIPQLIARVHVTDSNNTVAFRDEKQFTNIFPTMDVSFTSTWNTGVSASGIYTVTVDFFAGDQLLASKSTAFTILPQPVLQGLVSVDTTIPVFGQNFTSSYTVSNKGNTTAAGILLVTIQDPANQLVVASFEQAAQIHSNSSTSGTAVFNTSTLSLKSYQVVLSFNTETSRQVVATSGISVKDGMPPAVIITSPVDGAVFGKDVALSVQASDDTSGIERVEYSVDGGSWKVLPLADPYKARYSTVWTPTVAETGWHTVSFRGTDKAGNTSPANSVKFGVQSDSIPPVLSVTPAGGVYNTPQTVQLSVNEPATIYFTIDGSVPTISSAVYNGPLTIAANTTLRVLALDTAGNQSSGNDSYVIDTIPPILIVSTLPDGSYTNNEVLNISGTVTDNVGVKELLINGVPVPISFDGKFSQALLLKSGENKVEVKATDLATNLVEVNRTIYLDQKTPLLVIDTPADNSKTGTGLINVAGSVDETSTVEVSLDGVVQTAIKTGSNFLSTVVLVPGAKPNTIGVTATDLANNQSSEKRTIYYDDLSPSLAITEPGQDTRTNQKSLTIRGTASDPYGFPVTVSIDINGQKFSPQVVDGKFEQIVNFTAEDTYRVIAIASNEFGHSSSVPRNLIFDTTLPPLSIDPVISPTVLPSQTIGGKRENGVAVNVTCATATVGVVEYPTDTTWSVALSGMRTGDNVITVQAHDVAGNESTEYSKITVLTVESDVTFTVSPTIIWPPNHKMVSVTIGGKLNIPDADVRSVSITFTDEYGKYNYSELKFGSTVQVEAWRDGADKNGRSYLVMVVVTRRDGSKTTTTTTVLVPHDMGK